MTWPEDLDLDDPEQDLDPDWALAHEDIYPPFDDPCDEEDE